MNKEIIKLFEKAYAGQSITQKECAKLLALEDASPEAAVMRGLASAIVRERTGNTGVIFAQIGLQCYPCRGNCSFCSFAEKYTQMPVIKMDDETIATSTKAFTSGDQLFGLWLMTMADYDLDEYLEMVQIVKNNKIGSTNLYTNIGDTSYEAFAEIKAAGLDGVYHCWRLGEGRDTMFSSKQRKQTMINAKKAGLDILDALEPIGVEHTPEEMAEHIFFSIEMETIQYGVMKRISVPGTHFEKIPEITNYTLSKYAAAVVLSMAGMKKLPWIGIHEPSIHGYMSGANLITAETGVNPRDTVADTLQNRGIDIADCRRILKDAGYKYGARGDGSRFQL
jgi:biotin synthase